MSESAATRSVRSAAKVGSPPGLVRPNTRRDPTAGRVIEGGTHEFGVSRKPELKLSNRGRVLWEIAERYHELVDPLNSGEGIRGTGDLVPLMPSTYTATVKEFERLFNVMRNQAKQQSFRGESVGTLRWHILEWHLKAERIVRLEVVTVKQGRRRVQLRHPNGDLVMRPNVGYRRDRDAREGKAADGIEWIAQHWGRTSEPVLWVDPELVRESQEKARREARRAAA